MSMSDEKVRMKIRLAEEEKTKLEHSAALCGLSQAEYVRQVCLGRQPRPKPPAEFWELMDTLYTLHDFLERLTVHYPEFEPDCREVERLVLLLQEVA